MKLFAIEYNLYSIANNFIVSDPPIDEELCNKVTFELILDYNI